MWRVWLLLAGRGFGKTRTAVEKVREWVGPRNVRSDLRIALVGRTAGDVRDVMVEGESGILRCCPPWNRPAYEPSKRRLTWPNGAQATTYSADKPDQLRGPQHHKAWADEPAAWRFPDAWDQLQFGLRLGDNPQVIASTTPRPIPLVRELVARSSDRTVRGARVRRDVAITRGSTYDNRGNLPAAFLDVILAKYEGTRLGRQELYAEILDDTPGALWKRAQLEKLYVPLALRRRDAEAILADLGIRRVVVAVDPAVSAEEGSDETGIVVVGLDEQGIGYVLEDLSGIYSPLEWAEKVVDAYRRWKADRVVAEVNQGGDLVASNVRNVDDGIPFRAVRATKGKHTRAEPVAALYEQSRIRHVGAFAELEDQMCIWVPGVSKKSPDRLDALVWGFTDLILDGGGYGDGLLMGGRSNR